MEQSLRDLLDDHLLAGLYQQTLFERELEDGPLALDEEGGFLQIGQGRLVPAQILGLSSDEPPGWTWGWAIEGVPESLAVRAREAVGIGDKRLGSFLTAPFLTAGALPDRDMVVVAIANLLGARASVPCSVDEGVLHVLVDEPPVSTDGASGLDALDLVMHVSRRLPFPVTRRMVSSLLAHLEVPAHDSAGAVALNDGTEVVFTFDAEGRLSGIRGVTLGEMDAAAVAPAGEGRGVSLAAWADPHVESQPGWRDIDGRSPVDVYSEYLRARHAWDAETDPAADARVWSRALARLEAIHARLSAPRPIAQRDQSLNRPPDRDIDRTRLVSVSGPSAGRATLVVEENRPAFTQVHEVHVVERNGRWRLHDRVALFDDGERVSGLL